MGALQCQVLYHSPFHLIISDSGEVAHCCHSSHTCRRSRMEVNDDDEDRNDEFSSSSEGTPTVKKSKKEEMIKFGVGHLSEYPRKFSKQIQVTLCINFTDNLNFRSSTSCPKSSGLASQRICSLSWASTRLVFRECTPSSK